MIRIGIVDDHAVVRAGLRQYLADHVDLRVTGEATNGAEALELEPAACPRPGLDCPVEVRGDIERSRYGMDDWRVVLSDRVRFLMQVWLKEAAP